jgi:hypothetical protein
MVEMGGEREVVLCLARKGGREKELKKLGGTQEKKDQ